MRTILIAILIVLAVIGAAAHGEHPGSADLVEATEPYPTISFAAEDAEEGIRLLINTTNFDIAPNGSMDGDGHVHLYINGVKAGRIYEYDSQLSLPNGSYNVHLRLGTHNHSELAKGGVAIHAFAEVVVGYDGVLKVRATKIEPDNRYTFTCQPQITGTRYWSIRPDSGALIYDVTTPNASIVYDLSPGELYHVGCQMATEDGISRGDFHIDLRDGPNPDRPTVVMTEGFDDQATFMCTPPTGTGTHTYHWTLVGIGGSFPLESTVNTVAVSVPGYGLWDIDCAVHDSTNDTFTQHGLPIEFNLGVTPYVPSADGCVPGEGCPLILSAGAPRWLEPSLGSTNVDPLDFHIQVLEPSLPDGVTHIETDYELWDSDAGEPVWVALDEQEILYHIHNVDGDFVNRLNGAERLEYDRSYTLRARFTYSNGTVTDWSDWRDFRTRPEYAFVDSPYEWTPRDGYRVDLITDGVSTPVNLAPAPDLYDTLPESERPMLYVTQLYGQVGVITEDGTYRVYADELLNYESFGSIPGSGETGVSGLYVDPDTGDLFVSMVYDDPISGFLGKVVRFDSAANGLTYDSITTIIDGIPVAPSHQVQQITRGPDGLLYLNTGDDDHAFDAPDPSILSGKVLRFHENGTMPADNPFPGTYTYAAGLRNPFGAAWRPGTDELYITNNGADSDDGIFQVNGGETYGWCCDTKFDTWHLWPETVAPVSLVFDTVNLSDGGSDLDPVTENSVFFVAISGKTYLEGQSINAKRIMEFHIEPDGEKQWVEELVTYTGDGRGSPIGMAMKDGSLYFADIYGEIGFTGVGQTNGRIYRVTRGVSDPEQPAPGEFYAALRVAPWYPQGLNVIWDCGVANGLGPYRYSYTFGDGAQQVDTDQSNVWHTYASEGRYNATCTVHDLGLGLQDTSYTSIVLGDDPIVICGDFDREGCVPEDEVNTTDPGNETPDNETPGGDSDPNLCVDIFAANATCTGGSITADNAGGCRSVTCESGDASLTIQACQKGDGAELIETARSGSGLAICIGEACLDPLISGYAAYTCEDTDPANDTGNETDPGDDSGNETDPQMCHDVFSVDATCNGGTIDSDVSNGCRIVSCSSPSASLEVMACQKGDRFEMYEQQRSGTGISICLGSTCLDPLISGFAQSTCSEGNTTDPVDEEEPVSGDFALTLAPWYPQGNDAVLVCETDASTIDWDFGDGTTWYNSALADVWHTYPGPGTYEASCVVGGEIARLNVTIR